MDKVFQIGDFVFRLCYPANLTMPDNFLKFERSEEVSRVKKICAGSEPEYTYHIEFSEKLPESRGKLTAKRPDLLVYRNGKRESRLIGVKGRKKPYACYCERAEDHADIILDKNEIKDLHVDPVFTALFALEKRLIRKGQMILHCAYTEYRGEAVLFSAPSETGKTTQANLWEKYRGSRNVNGDRALLGKTGGIWKAHGWPVCGTSGICSNETFPIRSVVMLSQADKNHAERLTPGQAFPLLYGQITVNKWNVEDHIHAMDLIEDFLGRVPVYHLGCTISEEAVDCLEKVMAK